MIAWGSQHHRFMNSSHIVIVANATTQCLSVLWFLIDAGSWIGVPDDGMLLDFYVSVHLCLIKNQLNQ